MENFNNNKERKKLFKRVDKMKEMQEGKKAKVKTKSIQKIAIMVAVLVLIIMLILMVFRQNAIIISRQDSEHYRTMTYDEVQPGEEATNSEYVQFDAYFLKDINNDGIADKVRGTCNEIGTTDDLYMDLTVLTNGYLKDAKIMINNDNFCFATEIAADSQIKNDYMSSNTREIEFNQLENGTHVLLSGKVNSSSNTSYHYKYNSAIITANDYNKINSVVLTGMHVEELADGTTKETQIEKRVEFQVDWYGTLDVEWYYIYNNQINDADIILDNKNNLLNINFGVGLDDTKGSRSQLLFKTAHIEGILPEINGYAPIDVKLTTNYYGSIISYNKDTRKFVVESNNFNYNTSSYNESIQVSYPLESYNSQIDSEKSIEVLAKGWVEGYNNPNEEFQNPYKSNEAENTLKIKLMREITEPTIECKIGNFYSLDDYRIAYNGEISKEKPARIYNGISKTETEDYFLVEWNVDFDRDNGYLQNGVILKESKDGDKSDEFIKSDGSIDSMEDLTTNVGIYFGWNGGDFDSLLGEDGWIKIYDDDTNELLVTFTKENWSNWSQYNMERNMYKYEEPVKHIRIETSAINSSSIDEYSYVFIYNIKELDDEYITSHYTKEKFDDLKYVKSYVYMYTKTSIGVKEATTYDTAPYEYPITGVGMDLDDNDEYYDKAIVSTQQERDMKIRIGIPEKTIEEEELSDGFLTKWVDG